MSSLLRQSELLGASQSVSLRTGAVNRAFDVVFATAGLLFLSPLFGVIAVAIKVDDGGPVFYSQNRVGKGFQPFRLCKFRSMVTGADRHSSLTAPGDSRLTRVGRWLRHYKLDELPQLFNVLKGDMQLVGSRPEVERYVRMFSSEYDVILRDRPGITDPASLAYRREDKFLSSSQIEQQYVEEILPAKLKLSLEYQQRRNFLSDVGILLQTTLGVIL
jgi:lipopolysaccharide/colanic/teichoic acid biosynthesis glycosyltransferase